jgi:hypothetical protein
MALLHLLSQTQHFTGSSTPIEPGSSTPIEPGSSTPIEPGSSTPIERGSNRGQCGAFEAWAHYPHYPYSPCRGALPKPELADNLRGALRSIERARSSPLSLPMKALCTQDFIDCAIVREDRRSGATGEPEGWPRGANKPRFFLILYILCHLSPMSTTYRVSISKVLHRTAF